MLNPRCKLLLMDVAGPVEQRWQVWKILAVAAKQAVMAIG